MMMMIKNNVYSLSKALSRGVAYWPTLSNDDRVGTKQFGCLSLFLLSALIIIFITIIIIISSVVVFTARGSFHVSLCWLSCRFCRYLDGVLPKTIKWMLQAGVIVTLLFSAADCSLHSCISLVSCKISQWQQEREMTMRRVCLCIQVCKNVRSVCLYLSVCIWVSVIICMFVCVLWMKIVCVWCYMCVCVSMSKSVCLCVVKAQQVFLVFRAVRRRPLQGRGVGGRRGQHARLWGSLASRRGHSPPHFLWWTDGPCSAWLQKKTANEWRDWGVGGGVGRRRGWRWQSGDFGWKKKKITS